MTATLAFPGSVVTNPTGEVINGLTVKSDHVEQLYLEVVAIEQSLLGALGVNRIMVPVSNAGVPLTIRGVASQSADLINVGSSASATDRLTLSTAGQLWLPATGQGLKVGPSSFFITINTSSTTTSIRNNADSNGGIQFGGATVQLHLDTSNNQLSVGDTGSTAYSGVLGLRVDNPGTTAASGMQFGSDTGAKVNLYRSAANTLKTDANVVVAGSLNIGTTTTFNVTPSGTYTGTAALTLLAKDLEIRKSNGNSRLILSSANGTRFALKVDNTGQLITEAA